MTRRHRLIKGAGLLTITEVVSRFFPLFIIRQTTEALGLNAFGEMQVLMATIDILIQLIGPGYGTFAALEVSKDPSNVAHVSRIASLTILIRLIHALAILILLVPLAGQFAGQSTPIIFGLATLSFLTVFDMEFLHSSLQKMAPFSVLVLIAKITGFLLILTQVKSPSDKYLYTVLVLGTNSLISMATFYYHKNWWHWQKPSMAALYEFLKGSLPFNLGLITVGMVDRLDLILVKKFFTDAQAGVYAIPLKLTQSLFPLLISVSRVFFSEMLAGDVDRNLITKIVRVETLLALGVLIPMVAGSYWTGAYVLNLIFSVNDNSYGLLLAILSFSAAASLVIHIYGYQVLWRHQKGGLVIKTMLFVLFACVAFSSLGVKAFGLPGIPIGIIAAKVVACGIFVKAAKAHVNRLPFKEIIVVLIFSALMAAVVSQIQNPPVAIATGLLTYLLLHGLYYRHAKDHPLRR
jgi:O-antigen/teichoic acid export membrane protein